MAAPVAMAPLGAPAAVDRTRLAVAAGVLLGTLLLGLVQDRVAAVLFVLGVLVSLFVLRWTFPAMWLYGIWLAAVYALGFLGALVFALAASVQSPLVGPVPVYGAAAVGLELFALYIGLSLFAEIKSIRDFRTRLSIARGDNPPEYTRIGLWTLALVAFFAVANVSALMLVAWVRGAPTLPVHASLEGLLIGLGLYVLYLPEGAFGQLPPEYRQVVKEPEPRPGLVERIGERARGHAPAGGRTEPVPERCPVCSGALQFESRSCPSCGVPSKVGWCPKSEVHVVACEHCGRPVVYGKPVCAHCRGELKEAFACAACKAHAPLREWRAAPG